MCNWELSFLYQNLPTIVLCKFVTECEKDNSNTAFCNIECKLFLVVYKPNTGAPDLCKTHICGNVI